MIDSEQNLYSSGVGNTADTEPLNNNHNKRTMRNRFKLQIYLVGLIFTFIGGFCIANVLIIAQNATDLINQSVEMDIKNVEIDSVTTKGVNLRVQGINMVDYEGIANPYYSTLFKAGGGLFSTATVKLDPINLAVILPAEEGQGQGEEKTISIGTVEIPEFDINIRNGDNTRLELLVSLYPKTFEIFKLVRKILNQPNLIFNVLGDSKIRIRLGSIPIGEFQINFMQQIMGSKYFEFNNKDLKIVNLQISENEQNLEYNDVQFILSLPNPIKYKLFGVQIPELSWDVSVEDCDEELNLKLLLDKGIKTDKISISPKQEELNINVSTSFKQLNPELYQECLTFEEKNKTPFKKLMNEFLFNETLPVKVTNRDGGSSEFPNFINDVLKYFEFNFNYYSNFNEDLSRFIKNVSIEDLSFEFQNGDPNGKPILNGQVELFLFLPFNISNIKIEQIKGLPKLYYKGEEFGEILINEWHECQNELLRENAGGEKLLFVSFKLNNEEILITNRIIFGKVLNEIITKGSSTVTIDALLDAQIATFVGEFEVDGLHVNSESVISRSVLF